MPDWAAMDGSTAPWGWPMLAMPAVGMPAAAATPGSVEGAIEVGDGTPVRLGTLIFEAAAVSALGAEKLIDGAGVNPSIDGLPERLGAGVKPIAGFPPIGDGDGDGAA